MPMQAHPAAALFPLLADADLAELAADIRANGLRLPIVTFRGEVLDGRNRLRACELAGVSPRFVEHDGSDPWRLVWSLNKERRHIEDQIRLALIGERMVAGSDDWQERQERARAESSRAKSDGGKKGGRGNKAFPSCEGKPLRDRPAERGKETAARLAEAAGVSRPTMERALALKTKDARAAAQVISGEKNGMQALRDAKEAERASKRDANAQLVMTAPDPAALKAVYSTIVIDPPWDWGDEGDADQMGRARPTYSTMSIDELRDFPAVRAAAAKDAHLYLWITNRSLPKGFALMEAWGFRYVTCLTWCKPSIGMGNYFRGSTEHVLFGVRGSLALARKDVGTWFAAARPGRHSAKPDAFYALVETCSPGPYLDVFARAPRAGWTTFGAEVGRAA